MKRARFLRFAALQFVVLVGAAMAVYPGGTWWDPTTTHYQLAHNFLSDLGATHAFSGRANTASMLLFAIALVTIGGALVAFAWSWRSFAFGLARARWAGRASELLGTASGLAFVGIALAPVDRALDVHNVLVASAFGLLLAYVACMTLLMWRNRVGHVAINALYLAIVAGYVAFGVFGPRMATEIGFEEMVIAQKVVVVASMTHIVYLTSIVR